MVGAGLSGAVMARAFAEAGHKVLVIDERTHVAGNCYTERDTETGVMIHKYGPHIFHTENEEVWSYVNRFAKMRPYVNRVKAVVGDRIYSLPINLFTINQFFGKKFSPTEAKQFLESQARLDINDPQNFEEQALRFVGNEIYQAFFAGYTKKQWGCEPSNLPASILKRLPIRFNYDDNYFSHPYQAIPEQGYTDLVENILKVEGIEVRVGCRFEDISEKFSHIFYSGPLDRYFGYCLGRLGYRTLDFEPFRAEGDFQGTAVMNYCDLDVPYTRITEHKHFAPWEAKTLDRTMCFREFSRDCTPLDIPYYPIRLIQEKKLLSEYVERANMERRVTFIGRLGTYRYLDMDVCIGEALQGARSALEFLRQGAPPPVFFNSPI
jgi:UDP-galactopyranose mutase